MAYLAVQIILIILILLVIFWEIELLRSKGAPFLVSSNRIIEKAFELLEIKDSDMVYDLGCGNCDTLIYFSKKVPLAKYIGIEKSFLAKFSAIINLQVNGSRNRVKLINTNFMDSDLSEATKIYMWLSTKVAFELSPKLKKELKPGTKVVCCNYPLTGVEPVKVAGVDKNGFFGKRLYLYEF